MLELWEVHCLVFQVDGHILRDAPCIAEKAKHSHVYHPGLFLKGRLLAAKMPLRAVKIGFVRYTQRFAL